VNEKTDSRIRWLAWGAALLALGAGFSEPERFAFHLGHAALYGLLIVFLGHEGKIGLLFGIAVGLSWLGLHLGLTRWVITSAFGLWQNWRIALESNPAGLISMLLALLSLGLATESGSAYAKRADKSRADGARFLVCLALLVVYYIALFWVLEPQWLRALLPM
jgi:hypothetical protein